MKCPHCGADNKENAKACRKCGLELSVAPMWFPDAKWHLKTLGTIYVVLTIFYIGVTAALKTLPKPYHLRKIPVEMTPWLRSGPKHLPEEQLKAPPPEEPAK